MTFFRFEEFFLLTSFGLVFGSFINMLIYRLPNQLSIMPRSFCIKCKHKLGLYDLIPLVSYIFSFGNCRYCKKRISIRYPLVEITSVFIWFINWHFFNNSIEFYVMVFFFSSLLILFITDFTSFFIPNVITYPLIVLGLFYNFFNHNLIDSVYGILVGFFSFFLIGLIGRFFYKKNSIGGGDMKLAASIGSLWGLKTSILTVYFSFIVGGSIGLVLVLLGIKKRSDLIAFGPSIIAGFFISLFWGDWIWRTYISG